MIATVHRIAEFIRQNHAAVSHWSDAALIRWLQWFVNNQLLCIVREGDQIKAVGMARGVKDAEEAKSHYAHDDAAEHVWIELAVAEDAPGNLSLLFKATCDRFPNIKTISFSRTKDFATKVRTMPVDRIAKHLKGHY